MKRISSGVRRRSVIWAAALAVAASAALAGRAATTEPTATAPDYAPFTRSVHVPFGRYATRAGSPAATRPAVNFDHLTSMNVRISVNGGPPLNVQVDTGSTGVILGATEVPGYDPHGEPGSITYSSSGVELDGTWSNCEITFLDAESPDGKPVVTHVPVLAATRTVIHPGAVNNGGRSPTTASTAPYVSARVPHPYMFGVGFGRGKDPHPERNPFLNLTQMRNGTMRRGYIINRDGYTLGLTAKDVGTGWSYQKLNERTVSTQSTQLAPGLKDWETSRGWVVVDGKREPEAPILLDTGLTNFMLWQPGLPAVIDLPRGTAVEVNLLGGQLHYSFKSVEAKDKWPGDPVVPLKLSRCPTTSPVSSVNTGLRAFAIYDYLYDADGGYLGLRPTRPHP
jgi:hypothetical protein